jgi:hypothetical protein
LYRSKVVNEYGVGIDRAAGCMFDDEMAGFVRGYNSVSWPVINARVGEDKLEQASNAAQAEWLAAETAHAKERAVGVGDAIKTTGARQRD